MGLADRLIASHSAEAQIEGAWTEEIACRIAKVEAGHVPMIPAEEAIARARHAVK